MIKLRGYAGCTQRMQELMARFAQNQPTNAKTLSQLKDAKPAAPAGAPAGSPAGVGVPARAAALRPQAPGSFAPLAMSGTDNDDFTAALRQARGKLPGGPMAGGNDVGGPKPLDPMQLGFDQLRPTEIKGNSTQDLRQLAREAAARNGVDPNVFLGLVEAESGFDPKKVSKVGAQGLTQLMPRMSETLGVNDPLEPKQNLDAGAKYFSQMLQEFGGDMKKALAAYNAGPGAVRHSGGVPPFEESHDYVRKVLKSAEEYKKK